MKKLLIAAILFCGFTATISAQAKGDIEMGVNTGINFATARTNYFQADSRAGFNVALGADYYFSDRWSLKAKLYYDQKGWNNGSYTNANGTFPADYSLNYLTIPVMANWHFGTKRNWYLNFGPYAGFLMSAKESSQDTDVKEGFKSSDFGIALGIGVKIPVSERLKLFIEYDEQAGMGDIFKENPGSAVRNDRGSFNIGLNFMLK
jgi:opacity protein-like surface antigen